MAIFDALRTLLTANDDRGEPTAHTLQMATAALLLEVSRADFNMRDEELAATAKALQRRFAFGDEETQALVNSALAQEKNAISLHPCVRLINEHYTAAQKRQIVEDMWQVAYADQSLDKYEEAQIRKIADLLYVSHKDFIRAKLRTLEAIGK